MTIMNIKGVTLHLTDSTAADIQRDLDAYEAEQREWKRDMEDLEMAAAVGRETGDWSFYSDVYKDVYGVRPRW